MLLIIRLVAIKFLGKLLDACRVSAVLFDFGLLLVGQPGFLRDYSDYFFGESEAGS